MNPSVPWLVLLLLLLVAALSVASCRIQVTRPVLMLVAGVAIAFVPVWPGLSLEPELVLTLLLPPLLYTSGVNMSWRGFRSYLRPILLLAVGCVLFTAVAVAAVVHWAFGFPWAVGLVLGAIVSPPDSVAPAAVLRSLGVPRRLVSILEGESLVNDATALVLFSFALAAVVSGELSIASGVARFGAIVLGELAWGITLGWVMLRLRRLAADPRAEVLLALATPYLAFWPPHQIGGSGVIACVACGLYISWNGRDFISPATRLQGYFIWDLVSWTVEAVLFLLTGLQAHRVLEAIARGGLDHAIVVALLVSLTVILIRFVWVFPATYLPRLLPWCRRRAPPTDWRSAVLVAYTGLRGAVSLAAALSIPLMAGAEPFPHRDLILFTTFVVIAATLVGQGAPLPRVVRALGLTRAGREEAAANRRDEDSTRLEALEAVLAALDQAQARGVSEGVVASLRRQHADRRRHLSSSADVSTPDDPVSEAGQLQLKLVRVERAVINRRYLANRLTDEARRRIERELDLEEAQIRHVITNAGARSGNLQEA
ncbi:MAG: Na+/H+ antiporter [Rhizobacter sp.]|nr:Na+/H+ antiporter [Rhizobacter sp.]